MAEQVNIASLTIDVDDVIKESGRLKKEIDTLRKAQKQLDTTTEAGSQAYAVAQVEINKLSKAYKDNQQFATALDKVNEDLTKTMSTQGKSTQELRDSRSQLNKVSKNIVGNTEEEIKLREDLNKAIDEQTEALRDQSSEFNSSKDQVGEYESNILSAVGKLGIFGGALDKVRTFQEKFNDLKGDKVFKAQGVAAKGASKGVNIMSLALKLLVAVPIVLLITAIVGGFLLIKNAMDRSEESTTKIKKAFAAFSGIVKGLMKVLEPLGEFLIDGLVKGFELVEKGLFKTLSAIQKGLKFLGFDDAAKSLGNFTEKVEESAKASKELVEAELELVKAQRIARIVELEFLKGAEKLRQIRDDESKSIPIRIKANKELGELLKKQLKEELALAENALIVADKKIQLEGETTDAINERFDALENIADIQERITGQESEQLVNSVSLQKELKAIEEESAETKRKIQEDFQKLIEADIDKELDLIEEANEKELDLIISKNEKILEANQEKADELLSQELHRIALQEDIEKKTNEAGKKLANELFNFGNDLGNRRVDNINKQLEQGFISEKEAARKIATIQRKQAIAERAQALFNVGLSTAQGVMSVLSTGGGTNYADFGISAGILSGLVIGTGAVQAGAILANQLPEIPALKGGGMVRGKGSGKSDSINARLSNGESVNNANSTRMFAPLYSYLNVLGGGKPFASGGIAGSASGISSGSIIDYDILASRIAEANKSIPAPQVSVEEIKRVGNNVDVIEGLATS